MITSRKRPVRKQTTDEESREALELALAKVNEFIAKIAVTVEQESIQKGCPSGCFGSAGTFGSHGGCCGSYGTYGCQGVTKSGRFKDKEIAALQKQGEELFFGSSDFDDRHDLPLDIRTHGRA